MASRTGWIFFDESGGFESDATAGNWTIVALAGYGDRPDSTIFEDSWRDAWRQDRLGTPDVYNFHASEDREYPRYDAAVRQFVAQHPGMTGVYAFGGVATKGATKVDYLECILKVIVETGVGLFDAAPPGALTITVDIAFRQPFNHFRLARRAEKLLFAALERKGRAPAPIGIIPLVAPFNTHAALVLSDLLCNASFRAIRDGQRPPFKVTLLDPLDQKWRLSPGEITALSGKAVPIANPQEVAEGANFLPFLAGNTPFNADEATRRILAEYGREGAAVRFAATVSIARLGDELVERSRDTASGERAAEICAHLCTNAAWTEGWQELDFVEMRVRIESLCQVMENHAGTVLGGKDDGIRDRVNQLLAADRATDAALLLLNRRVIGLSNAFQFDDALSSVEPIVAYVRARISTPFAPAAPSAQLGQYLGTYAQLLAICAYNHGVLEGLAEAGNAFVEAVGNFSNPSDVQRQITYQIHLLGEEVRLDANADKAAIWAEVQSLDAGEAAGGIKLLSAREIPGMGMLFRVHAVAKLAALCGANWPLPEAAFSTLSHHALNTHPLPLLAAWLDAVQTANDPAWPTSPIRAALRVKLQARAGTGDLIGFLLGLVLLDQTPAGQRPDPTALAIPESIREGWEASGISTALAQGWPDRPSDLLPLNFC